MRNVNKKSKGEFLLNSFNWSILGFTLYYVYCFKCISGWSYIASKALFWGLAVSLSIIGFIVTFKRRRNTVSLITNLTIPLIMYSVLAYSWYFKAFLIVIAGIAATLGLLYCVAFIVKRRNRFRRSVFAFLKESLNAILGLRTIVTCCFLPFVIILVACFVFSGGIPSTTASKAHRADGSSGETLDKNIAIVAQLEQNTWDTLSAQERLDTLQTVANIEANYLGLPFELSVYARSLGEYTEAGYKHETHMIIISAESLEMDLAEEMLDSVCHEAYHAYQHCLCDAYDTVDGNYKDMLCFYRVPFYKDEFANYIDGDTDILGYIEQKCEIDARRYAGDSVKDYYDRINTYLGSYSNIGNS